MSVSNDGSDLSPEPGSGQRPGEEIDRLLRFLRNELPSAGAIDELRRGVHAQLRARRRRNLLIVWGNVAAIVVLALALRPLWRPLDELAWRPRTAAPPSGEIAKNRGRMTVNSRNFAVAVPAPGAGRAARPTIERAASTPEAATPAARRDAAPLPQTEFVKIVTDDPGIVILWALEDAPAVQGMEGMKRKGASLL
jgi:hypothetical protein